MNPDVNPGVISGLPDGAVNREPNAEVQVEPELAVDLCGVPLVTPIMAASGCFGFGREMADFLDLAAIGGVVTKWVSLEPRRGDRKSVV